MSTWSKDEPSKIAQTDDLDISPFREDGGTHGAPTWIGSVVVDGTLCVRPCNGRKSRWYQATATPRRHALQGGFGFELQVRPASTMKVSRVDRP